MAVVFITGGARRIGRGLALNFARRGWDVGITYREHSTSEARDLQAMIQSMGQRCEIAECDLTDAGQLQQAFEHLTVTLGVADAVVSNAGIFPQAQKAADLSEADILYAFQCNTVPLLTISKLYASSLDGSKSAGSKQGRLVALGSLGSIEIWKQRIAYNVSKSALLTLAKTLARDWAPGISINVVAPGAITFPEDPTEGDKVVVGIDKVPMGRHATVDDVFDAVWFFCTASHYITGQMLSVDGGYHLVR